MELIGTTTIHPLLFYTGKISGYIVWALLVLLLFGLYNPGEQPPELIKYFSYALIIAGLSLVVLSAGHLGRSTRLGLPTGDTRLKTHGIYRLCRNPMYLGFNLLTAASAILNWNIWIALAGMYSVAIYHRIILGEERFLARRFGDEYLRYRKSVRRYI